MRSRRRRTHRQVAARGGTGARHAPQLLFCENDSNAARLFGAPAQTPYPKDGINDHVVSGAATVNPRRSGTKMACWYRETVTPNETIELRLRLTCTDADGTLDLAADFERTFALRAREADEYHASMRTANTTDEEAAVMRQAFAGSVWSQQFYHYDVARWLDGDPAQPAPPAARKTGRNADWRHLNNHDIIAMPDKWEYPWYAAWDLAFHCVVLANTDPAAAKHQLLLMCREWYMHPNGQLPAYEWKFEDVNPPVHAWAALAVFRIDGGTDFEFLASAFHKLLINFTWWVNRKDALGDNIFEGGFLGLDNIGPFDRSAMLPDGGVLEQSDGTAWMGKFCLNMLEMALRLANRDRCVRRRGAEVLRALRRHRGGDGRAVGRDGRLLLRPPADAGRIVASAARAFDGRSVTGLRRGASSSPRCGKTCRIFARAPRGSCDTGAISRASKSSESTGASNSRRSSTRLSCGAYWRGC